jgi:hypothetical protein
MAMAELCIPFGDLVMTSHSAGVFGAFAERRICNRYLQDVGRFKTGGQQDFFPFNVKDFHDPDNTWGRTDLFGEFIMTHNRGKISERDWKALKRKAGMLKVPDLMTHDPPRGDFEYYEIKPNSSSGPSAGLLKITILDALFAFYKLPYKSGIQWNVNEKELIATGFVWGVEMNYYLHYFRDGAGLVLYEICVAGNFAEVLARVGYIIFVAALVIALLAIIPKPVPV